MSLRLREDRLKKEEHSEGNSPASYNSPTQPKLAFGLKKVSTSNSSQSNAPVQSVSKKLDNIFSLEEDEQEQKPKKKLVPIEYSDEEEEESSGRSPESSRKRSRRSSGRGSSSGKRNSSGGRSSSHRNNDIGMVIRGGGGSGSLMGDMEDGRERKLTADERKKMVQTLVNNIPTAKEEVFQYQLKWDQIDKVCNRTSP